MTLKEPDHYPYRKELRLEAGVPPSEIHRNWPMVHVDPWRSFENPHPRVRHPVELRIFLNLVLEKPKGSELIGRDFGFDGVDLPKNFPCAIGTLGAEDQVAAGDGVSRFGFVFGKDGDSVGTVLADGVSADVAFLGMEFGGADGAGGKVVAVEAFDGFAASKGGKAWGHEGAIFGEERGGFDGIAFLGGEDPAVTEVGEDVGIGSVDKERTEGRGNEDKADDDELTETVHEEYRLLSSIGTSNGRV